MSDPFAPTRDDIVPCGHVCNICLCCEFCCLCNLKGDDE